MTRFKLGIASVLVIGSITASVMIQYRASARLREGNKSLHEEAATLAELSAENGRLSNIVEQTRNARPLTKAQLHELLRLRAQVGKLRETGAQKGELGVTNAQLKAAAAESTKRLAEEQAAPNYWSKDQLVFAGYGDPESAVKTFLWLMKTGDVSSWKTSCTPEAIAKLEKEWDKHKKTESERAAEMKVMGEAFMSSAVGFRILDHEMTSPDEVRVNLAFVGEGKARKFVLRRIGNDWKFHDIVFAGQKEHRH